MLERRVEAFIRGESGDSFEELALELFDAQYGRSEALRARCEERGVTPETISDWREVPLIAASDLEASATSSTSPGTALHRAVIDRSFPDACLEGTGHPPALSLIPADDSSADRAGLLADRLLAAWAPPDSVVAARPRGVEVAKARGFLAARQRDRRPTLVLGSAATLSDLLAGLDRRGLRFRLPAGSRVVEAGASGPGDRELLSRIVGGLGVPPEAVVREYAPVGLASRFYAGHRRRGEPRAFRMPPWARVRALDHKTLEEVPAGQVGTLAVFDLANAGLLAHLLTGDTGSAGESGFSLAAAA